MRHLTPFIFLLCLLLAPSAYGQPNKADIKKFLGQNSYPFDTEAAAVVLYERTNVEMLLDHELYVQKKYVHRFLKIIKTAALAEANVSVEYERYTRGEGVAEIKGTTYNLVDNQVVETPLPRRDHYTIKEAKDVYEVNFAMPEVRVGGIIEYSYVINSPAYLQMPPWSVQQQYPKLTSEYSISYPSKFEFMAILHVRPELKTVNSEEEAIKYEGPFCQYAYHDNGERTYSLWVRKNVQGIPNESYLWNVHNYLDRVDFQLTRNTANFDEYLTSWDAYNKKMWNSEMARNVTAKNRFLDDTIQAVVKRDTVQMSVAKSIFNYVRNNYHVENVLKRKQEFDIKDIFFDRGGSADGINALLTAMLLNAGLDAYLLMVSSNDEIPASEVFPVYNRLTHVVCAVKIRGKYVLLDASNKHNAFNQLPSRYYNGYSRIISKEGAYIDLNEDMLHNEDVHLANISIKPDGMQEVDYTVKFGMRRSAAMRRQLDESNAGSGVFFEKFVAELEDGASITSKKLVNVDNPDTNLVVKVAFTTHRAIDSANWFINPTYIKLVPKSPFKSLKRALPVEYGGTFKDSWYVNYRLPDGYVPAMLPEPVWLKGSDGDLSYLKQISYMTDSKTILVQAALAINKANFSPPEYPDVRAFYEQVIKEENKVLEIKRK